MMGNDVNEEQMAEAIQRMREHQRASLTTVRRGWTTRQWCEDAERLMNDLDGSVTSLVNGHVSALLRERKALLAVAEAAGGVTECHFDTCSSELRVGPPCSCGIDALRVALRALQIR